MTEEIYGGREGAKTINGLYSRVIGLKPDSQKAFESLGSDADVRAAKRKERNSLYRRAGLEVALLLLGGFAANSWKQSKYADEQLAYEQSYAAGLTAKNRDSLDDEVKKKLVLSEEGRKLLSEKLKLAQENQELEETGKVLAAVGYRKFQALETKRKRKTAMDLEDKQIRLYNLYLNYFTKEFPGSEAYDLVKNNKPASEALSAFLQQYFLDKDRDKSLDLAGVLNKIAKGEGLKPQKEIFSQTLSSSLEKTLRNRLGGAKEQEEIERIYRHLVRAARIKNPQIDKYSSYGKFYADLTAKTLTTLEKGTLDPRSKLWYLERARISLYREGALAHALESATVASLKLGKMSHLSLKFDQDEAKDRQSDAKERMSKIRGKIADLEKRISSVPDNPEKIFIPFFESAGSEFSVGKSDKNARALLRTFLSYHIYGSDGKSLYSDSKSIKELQVDLLVQNKKFLEKELIREQSNLAMHSATGQIMHDLSFLTGSDNVLGRFFEWTADRVIKEHEAETRKGPKNNVNVIPAVPIESPGDSMTDAELGFINADLLNESMSEEEEEEFKPEEPRSQEEAK